MKIAIALAVLATLTGCAVVPNQSDSTRSLPGTLTNERVQLNQSDSTRSLPGTFTNERVQLLFDDLDSVFQPVVGAYRSFAREHLETSEEYRQRIAALDTANVSGRDVTFLIAPDSCEIFAFPDDGFYVIVCNTSFFEPSYQSPGQTFSISIWEEFTKGSKIPMQNAFGGSIEVTPIEMKKKRVRFEGKDSLPVALRWKKDAHDKYDNDKYFGLPFRTTDPAFRALLRDRKVGLAIRGRIGDFAKSDYSRLVITPSLDSPLTGHIEVITLPFTLSEAFIIDTTTMTSIVRWTRQ